MFFIWNTIGAGLNEYIKQADNFSFVSLFLNKEIYLPIILFATVMIISVMIKKKIFDNRNWKKAFLKVMVEKLNWLVWLILVILWNYGFPEATPLQDVIVAVILSLLFIIIKLMRSRYLHKISSRSKNKI